MRRSVAYDIARLFLGPLHSSPRGIDRVDLATALHFFADDADSNFGVLPTPWGIRVYEADRVRRGLDHLQMLWAERNEAEHDPTWIALLAALTGETAPTSAGDANVRRRPGKSRRLLGSLATTGFALGRGVRTALPRGAVYLNVGQIGLAVPALHGWLGNRPDVAAVFMLHDVIPLEQPDRVEPSSPRLHARMVETAARHADALIATTRHASDTVAQALAGYGRRNVPTYVRALPLPEVFAVPRMAHAALAGCRYFVTCGAVEPRKNHGLLLAVWRRLAAQLGASAPHLVIAGSPGWRGRDILRPLAEDAQLRGRVHHAEGLPSPALARLMLGAAGVLCPSFAEGFGLTVLEANELGVPTVASDIAAHREIADSATMLLPPDDVDGWAAAVSALPNGGMRVTPPIPATQRETSYCRDIEAFLDRCAKPRRRQA